MSNREIFNNEILDIQRQLNKFMPDEDRDTHRRFINQEQEKIYQHLNAIGRLSGGDVEKAMKKAISP